MREMHERKNRDYAQDENWASNFERAATIASWFNDKIDKVFATMIGIKLARLAELKNGKVPNNESIADSMLDMDVYAVLWHAYYLERQTPKLQGAATAILNPSPAKYNCDYCKIPFTHPAIKTSLPGTDVHYFCSELCAQVWAAERTKAHSSQGQVGQDRAIIMTPGYSDNEG